MPPVLAYAPAPEVDLLAAYDEHCARLGLTSVNLGSAARTFLRRWPDPQRWAGEPLEVRLTVSHPTRSFVTFLMLARYLRPGYDYLIHRKLAVFWRHLPPGPLAEDLAEFLGAAQELGFTERTRSAAASQVIGRLLIQTGRRLDTLTDNNFDDLLAASAARHGLGKASRHYSSATHTARQVMFHLGVFTEQPVNATSLLRQSFAQRMRDATPALRGSFVAYLDRLTATHSRSTVTGTATRLNHFAAHLASVDPTLTSLTDLDRRRHIETYLTATAEATNTRTGAPIQASERRGRILAVHCLLNNIAEWGWPEAPQRRLVFRSDIPKLPRPLPRYLTPDLDRRLTQALQAWPERLPADALLLQRATGLRIGELVDLELDSVHEIPGQGAWLKVPLGKLNTERMVPLDEETVALIDRIVAHRSPGRPLPHPRTARPTDYLLTHHGRRLTADHLRDVLTRVTADAGLPHITPHQAAPHLRHRTGQRWRIPAEPDGLARPSLGGDEPALRTAVRLDRAHRIRASLGRRESPPGHPAHRATPRAHPIADLRRRLETGARGQGPPGRWLLHPRPSPRPVRLRQYLRTLPQLPHRYRLPARPGRSARRHRNPGP